MSPDLSNQLLWRQNSYRVPAETVRDIHLVASGLFEPEIGGPGIHPPLPEFVTAVGRSVKWPESTGPDRYRRGMYIFLMRTVLYPMLTHLRRTRHERCLLATRKNEHIPMQALTLLNDPVFFECAETLGRDLHRAHGENFDTAADDLFLRTHRAPSHPGRARYPPLGARGLSSFRQKPGARHDCLGSRRQPTSTNSLPVIDPRQFHDLQTRRRFLSRGLGSLALASMLRDDGLLAAESTRAPHFAPKAKRCIYLFMEGGPSQMDLFDPKPKLNELDGQPMPDSLLEGVKFAFTQKENGAPSRQSPHLSKIRRMRDGYV